MLDLSTRPFHRHSGLARQNHIDRDFFTGDKFVAVRLGAEGQRDVISECSIDFCAFSGNFPARGGAFRVIRVRELVLNAFDFLPGFRERFRCGGAIEIECGFFSGGQRLVGRGEHRLQLRIVDEGSVRRARRLVRSEAWCQTRRLSLCHSPPT